MSQITNKVDYDVGYSRKLIRGAFTYFDVNGKKITEQKIIERINSLAIPPAYKEVWISADPMCYLQATGIDARDRKQYVYHPDWQAMQLQSNFDHLKLVAWKLVILRKKIEEYLSNTDLEKSLSAEYVLSIVVKIIDQAYMRVGSAEYANDNDTYGITTIRKKHVSIKGSKIIFNYVGKSGINQLKELENPKIARAINQMLALPGYEVFKFHDSTGNICDVNAHNLNQFIDSITDGVMTAKNFRTWHGSVLAIERYAELYKDSNPTKLEDIYLYVSDRLGNTPAVVRDHYIHPSVIELIKNNQKLPTVRASKWLSKHEVILKKIIC